MQTELERIRAYNHELAPSNEAETCHWVIVPLLEACGYAKHDIKSQNSDGAGKFPDFTILWGTEHQWYLEAKSWNVKLSDDHINQAIYSAYSTGKRWVVLSNGREWRLYDASVHAPTPGDRLVAQALIKDEGEIERFLTSISKESVTSGKIVEFATESRVCQVVHDQLKNKDSLLIKKVTEVLRKELGVPNASSAAVQAALLGIKHDSQIPPNPVGIVSQVAKKPLIVNESANLPYGEQIHLLTPVKDEADDTVPQILQRLLGNGWYVFGQRTAYRKFLKPGDKIAFYYSGVGVVAEAEVASELTLGTPPGVKNPAKYPWQFQVKNVRIFLDNPVVINSPGFRSKMDAFKGKSDPNNWSWLVQGTGKVTEHDFNLLVGLT